MFSKVGKAEHMPVEKQNQFFEIVACESSFVCLPSINIASCSITLFDCSVRVLDCSIREYVMTPHKRNFGGAFALF